ncbi:MAG: ornithine carbamoyltransferase [Caldimonas sp.]
MDSLLLQSRRPLAPMSPRSAAALLDCARALQQAAEAGRTVPLLRGKNLGLMCASPDTPDAALFERAAAELGAQVAHIRPGLSASSTAQEVQHTARMLGRLYDAVECQGIASALVIRIGRQAGIPVYDALASQQYPTLQIAPSLDGDAARADNRRFVLQAVLLGAFA